MTVVTAGHSHKPPSGHDLQGLPGAHVEDGRLFAPARALGVATRRDGQALITQGSPFDFREATCGWNLGLLGLSSSGVGRWRSTCRARPLTRVR